ncbi:HAMP domain-containing histidine kinase [Bacillus sp. CMF21]|uniref:HAMP domain-containing sensor histidine kinase n=1 Tax=Metabacillus dongyingensis TaxID=2874282 RepID=UPI001CC0DF64|nr:HAMP domain-containing sensor histidine kinase [Metabacillus dongyingensis]UAL53827.1 HAMP domain-containing histidine kinase [Metabacillus dongyingensis]USK30139.1 HAMP domain-containing histidine kinase [Bacillus sp. CMF21]
MKWRRSLQFKYLSIILAAVLCIPISFSLASALVYVPGVFLEKETVHPYEGYNELTEMWHKEAGQLKAANDIEVAEKLQSLHKKYPGSQLFWVDKEGRTRESFSYKEELPDIWTPSYTISYMKNSFDADPFTVVAFIGDDKDKGFMVIRVDRMMLEPPIQRLGYQYDAIYFTVLAVLMLAFLFLSWLFFKRLHKRILRLKEAMKRKDHSGLPLPIALSNKDEIGELEESFNNMIKELEESREREKREEKIRKDLMASLSHDLRTPLTTMRAHLFSVKKESVTEAGLEAARAIDEKIDFISALIDNLFSYTLLSSGKYHYHPKEINLSRFVRKKAAEWYPVFEQHRFEAEIDLEPDTIIWFADPEWLERILDNLLQNIIRHADEGKYVGITVRQTEFGQYIMIRDRGNGFRQDSGNKGAGIGLTIVEMMTKKMNLTFRIDSDSSGTVISILKET